MSCQEFQQLNVAEEFVSDFKERKKCIFRAKTLKSLIKPTSKAIFPNQVILETPRDHDMFLPGISSGKRWNLGSVAGLKLFPGVFWGYPILSELIQAREGQGGKGNESTQL